MDDKIKKRCGELFDLGLKYHFAYESYTLDDINVHWTEMTVLDEKEWNTLIEKIKEVIASRNIKT